MYDEGDEYIKMLQWICDDRQIMIDNDDNNWWQFDEWLWS